MKEPSFQINNKFFSIFVEPQEKIDFIKCVFCLAKIKLLLNKLILNILKKDYPYKKELYDPNVCWAEIEMYIHQIDLDKKRILFKIEWDVNILLSWFIQNKKSILEVDFPVLEKNYKSIAEKVFNFYNTDEDIDEDKVDSMFEYRQCHGIRFGLRGTDIKDVYIGKNNEIYEVSFFNEIENWKYEIDLITFYEEINSKIKTCN